MSRCVKSIAWHSSKSFSACFSQGPSKKEMAHLNKDNLCKGLKRTIPQGKG